MAENNRGGNQLWVEGQVDASDDHFELRYGSASSGEWATWIPVARVAASRRYLTAEFLIAPAGSKNQRMIKQVKAELDSFFQLREHHIGDYLQHYCGTAANIYSSVHWTFKPAWSGSSLDDCYASARERDRHRSGRPGSMYAEFAWSHRVGIHRRGEFPVVVVRHALAKQGFSSWFSGQNKLGPESYLLERLPGKRRQRDPAYERTVEVFGQKRLDEFHERAKEARLKHDLRSAGGDPDLLVQRRDNPSEKFFVEVKLEDLTDGHRFKDRLNKQQRVLFPLIEERLCPVRIAKVIIKA